MAQTVIIKRASKWVSRTIKFLGENTKKYITISVLVENFKAIHYCLLMHLKTYKISIKIYELDHASFLSALDWYGKQH